MSDNNQEVKKPTYYLAEEFHQHLCDQMEFGNRDQMNSVDKDKVFGEFCEEVDLDDQQIEELRAYLKGDTYEQVDTLF